MTDISLEKILDLGKKAKLKVYHDFLTKIRDGGSLTPGELKVFNALEDELQGSKDQKAQIEIMLSPAQVGSFFGITRFAVQKWFNAGCPKEKRGQCDLKKVFDWWFENIAQEKMAKASGSLSESKELYWQAKARTEQIKSEQLEGLMLSREEVESDVNRMIAYARKNITLIPRYAPPLLEGLKRREMGSVLKDFVMRILNGMTKGEEAKRIEEMLRKGKQKKK